VSTASDEEAAATALATGGASMGDDPAGESLARDRRLAAARDLAAAVLHDVNNTLNPIVAAAFLMERRADDPAAVREYAGRIARAAQAFAATAERVGRFVRQEPPAAGYDLPLDLSVLAADALARARTEWAARAPAAGIAVDLRLVPDARARGLPDELRAALLSVLRNAADAMPTGGRLTVATGVAGPDEAPAAWIEVHDTGAGMSAEVRDRACDPFFTTKRPGPGIGLGLAEVYGVMCRHRGRVDIASVPGAGTTVRLVFPRVSLRAPAAPA
jgi:signal transduction histidine kinase